MSNIFQIQQDYFNLLSQIEENEGILTPEFEEALLSNEGDFNYKVENCVKMIHHWEGEIDTIKTEIERLNKLKKSKESSAESVKNNISTALQSRGIDKLTAGTNNLSFRKSEAIIITHPDDVPEEFVTEVTTESIDKMALKRYLKQGYTIEGVYIEERKNLQIK